MLLSEYHIFTFQPAKKNYLARELKFAFLRILLFEGLKCYLVTVTKQKTVYVYEEQGRLKHLSFEAYSQAVGNHVTSRGKTIVKRLLSLYLCTCQETTPQS